MLVTLDTLMKISGTAPNDNMRSVLTGLQTFPAKINTGLRFAHYAAHTTHESGRFHYDREVWGPTAAQARYDTRTDLGNTPERDGDGEKFKGHTAMQITGRYNTIAFRDWCRENVDRNCPDFEQRPEMMNTDPWEGLGPIWYWTTRGLNALADADTEGSLRGTTRAINGGYNGLSDRRDLFTRAGLVVLGYHPSDVKGYQAVSKLVVDGHPGPATRTSLTRDLRRVRVEYKLGGNVTSGGWVQALLDILFGRRGT